MLETREVHVLS